MTGQSPKRSVLGLNCAIYKMSQSRYAYDLLVELLLQGYRLRQEIRRKGTESGGEHSPVRKRTRSPVSAHQRGGNGPGCGSVADTDVAFPSGSGEAAVRARDVAGRVCGDVFFEGNWTVCSLGDIAFLPGRSRAIGIHCRNYFVSASSFVSYRFLPTLSPLRHGRFKFSWRELLRLAR